MECWDVKAFDAYKPCSIGITYSNQKTFCDSLVKKPMATSLVLALIFNIKSVDQVFNFLNQTMRSVFHS